jgi:hypothetical protein
MSRIALTAVLVLGLAASVFAAADSALSVSGFSVSGTGTLNGTGTLGGVSGTMTSSGGNWTMTVGGITFASGTYSCSGGACTYSGTVLGSTKTFGFTTASSPASITTATGFATHGAWVSTVAHWAGSHQAALKGAGMTPGDVVSGAAKDPASAHGNGGGGGGGGEGHGGGEGRGR